MAVCQQMSTGGEEPMSAQLNCQSIVTLQEKLPRSTLPPPSSLLSPSLPTLTSTRSPHCLRCSNTSDTSWLAGFPCWTGCRPKWARSTQCCQLPELSPVAKRVRASEEQQLWMSLRSGEGSSNENREGSRDATITRIALRSALWMKG